MQDVTTKAPEPEQRNAPGAAAAHTQNAGFLLELSSDWLIRRASENVHRFLKSYHQRLVGEPLADFTLAQPLHDLRNSLSRQRSSSGIARAYRVRLIDEPRYFDFAFRLCGGRILLEGAFSPEEAYGAWLGSVSRLIEGLPPPDAEGALDEAARRMRALTGFDRVDVSLTTASGERRGASSRGSIAPEPGDLDHAALPAIIVDSSAAPVPLFPRETDSSAAEGALLRSPSPRQLEELRERRIAAMLNVPLVRDGRTVGCFSCQSRTVRQPVFELHAAAELFAQIFAMRLEVGS